MKNKIVFIIGIMLMITVLFVTGSLCVGAESYSGACGSGVSWSLDNQSGALTLSGKGKMSSYLSAVAPWSSYASEIKSVTVEAGVTNVSAGAFKNCKELVDVELSSTVKEIGSNAFHSCTKLITVTGAREVESIGTGAFYSCTKMESINLPKVKTVGGYVFSYCSSLKEFEAPLMKSVGIDAFTGCKSLIVDKKGIYFVGDWVIGCSNDIIDLVVPEGTYGIAGRAFANRKNIVTAYLPDSVGDRIGGECFYGCTSLETLTMPMYFTLCTTEEGELWGESITYYYFFHIGTFFGFNSSFSNSICVPEVFHRYVYSEPYNWYSPKQTGNYFYIPNSLKEIYITTPHNMPTGANKYGPNGEVYESEYTDNYIDVDFKAVYMKWSFNESASTLTINGGGRMSDFEEGKAPWAEYANDIRHVKINGLKSIGTNAFYGCYYIEDVTVDENLTEISQAAFYYCTKLKIFDFTNIKTIGKYAFSHCKALGSVHLSDGCKVGVSAFENCSSIESIVLPNGGSVGQYAFSGCTSIQNLFVEEPDFEMGKGVFRNCTSLENIFLYVEKPESWSSDWLYGCDAKAHYLSVWHTISTRHCHKCSDPSCIIEEPHRFDDSGICSFCKVAKSGFVTLEGGTVYYYNGVIKTGWFYVGDMLCYAFEDTGYIVNYNCYIEGKCYVWNDVTGLSIADGFVHNGIGYRCYENGIQVIGWRHKDGSGPSIVDGIYEQYSQNPNELYYFLSTTGYMVTDSTYKLGGYIRQFNDDHTVKPLEGLQTNAGELYYYVDGVRQTGWHEIDGLTYYFRASDNVYGRAATKWMYIGNKVYYFYASTSAEPYALKTSGKIGGIEYTYSESGQILYNGFINCDYANKANSNTAANIQKMNGTTRYYINGEMQTGWREIDGETYYFYAIGSANGSGYMCVESRYIGGVWYEFTSDGKKNSYGSLDYTLNADGLSYSVSGIGSFNGSEVIIPNKHKNKPVTSIGDNAFGGCGTITSVIIPEGVTSIGMYAFSDCIKLSSVTIPKTVNVIDDYAFDNCRITSVYISDIAAWCSVVFKTLESNPFNGFVYWGEGVKNLYVNGELVTELIIPEGVTTIGSSAFAYCSGLTNVVIPTSVTVIGFRAFANCTGLTSINIPEGVTTLEFQAFYNCGPFKIKSVVIPESVTTMGSEAFGNIRNGVFFSEADSKPVGWSQGWNGIDLEEEYPSYSSVYWNGEWEYIDGVPTVKQ